MNTVKKGLTKKKTSLTKTGNQLQKLSFDAWNNQRDPATWRSFAGTAPEPLFDRGFTGTYTPST